MTDQPAQPTPAASKLESPQVAAPPARTAAPLHLIEGDRPCTHCSFNLAGQEVFREEHYRMLVVRCPECGTIEGVQEYPMLSPWLGRLRFLLAAAYFGFMAITAGLLGMFGGVFAAITVEIVQNSNNTWFNGPAPFYCAICLGAGFTWSVLLPRVRPIRFLFIALLITGIMLGFAFLLVPTIGYLGRSSLMEVMAILVAPTVLTYGGVFFIGLCTGRMLARWMVLAVLPPKLQAPWSFLWTCDGKPLPRPRKA